MTVPAAPAYTATLADEHSVLIWQTCAYADDLTRAARSGRRLVPAFSAMMEFLHYRLLPYLGTEERLMRRAGPRDDCMFGLLVADHARLQVDVDELEATRTRGLLTLAVNALVERLARHVHREERWLVDLAADTIDETGVRGWALPLLLVDEIDLEALPPDSRNALVLQRLQQLHAGQTLRLHAHHDLHPLWHQHHTRDPDALAWVYERCGPNDWIARITRRVRKQS